MPYEREQKAVHGMRSNGEIEAYVYSTRGCCVYREMTPDVVEVDVIRLRIS